LAAAEPIEKAAGLRPGPLPVGLILLVPEKLGLHCHAGRLGYRQNSRHHKPTRTYSHFARHIGRPVSIRIRPQLLQPRQAGEVPGGKRSNHHTIALPVTPGLLCEGVMV
jgi:hypothetical protein